eukprot:TRINITY_DN23697_c0_g1_i1.p1 TRINITY_DN23697_c0_g1~~TRINITY_DN23697_c0_g1_i1.p1  ORF type:complete len:634 (-),score=145.06 TRINITY_DN23697_c0_g1_i1:78-1898(-)
MDNLFVKKPTAPSRKRPGNDASGLSDLGKDGARQILEEMAREIVLDEAPNAETLTPDERRLRDGTGGAVDTLFSRRKENPEQPDPEQAGGALADALFARPGTGVATAGDKASPGEPAQHKQAVDSLFVSRHNDNPPLNNNLSMPSAGGLKWPDEDLAEEADEMTPEEANAAADAKELSRNARRRWSLNCTCGCREAFIGAAASCRDCRPELPDWRTALRRGAPLLGLAALLGLVTAGLATGCEDPPPLGRFCIVQGGDPDVASAAQLAIAFAPAVLTLLCLGAWLRRRFVLRQRQKAAAWRNDSDAQRAARAVLDALMAAAPAEQSKYARQVVQIIRDFPDKAVIQLKGCVALEGICRAQKGNAAVVQGAGAIPLVLTTLEAHRRVRQLQRAALGALACLGKVGRQQIFDLGGIPNIIASMAKFRRDSEVQVLGAMTLGALCLSSGTCRKSVAKYGGLGMLHAAMERHADRPDVLVAASETLYLICAGEDKELLAAANAALPMVQSLVGRWSDKAAGGRADDANIAVKPHDCEVVLRSLQKFEAKLLGSSTSRRQQSNGQGDDDDWSEAGTPRQAARKSAAKAEKDQAKQAEDLVDRFRRWNVKQR